jgi:hypothetical protein
MAQAAPAQSTPAAPPPGAPARPQIKQFEQITATRPLAKGRRRVLSSSEANFANLHGAVLPAGTPFEDALQPSFWSNHAAELRVSDQIQIHVDDGRYYGLLYVRSVSTGSKPTVLVATLSHVEFDAVTASDSAPPAYKVEHLGPHLEWCVIRLADGKAVAEHLGSRDDAERQMRAIENSRDRKVR